MRAVLSSDKRIMNRLKESHVSRINTEITFFPHTGNYYFAKRMGESFLCVWFVKGFKVQLNKFYLSSPAMSFSDLRIITERSISIYHCLIFSGILGIIALTSLSFFKRYSLISAPKVSGTLSR